MTPSTVVAVPLAESAPMHGAIDIDEADNAFFRDAKQVVVLKVSNGDPVRFRNKDGLPHRLYSVSDNNQFDLGQLHQFESRNVTFDRRGDVEVAFVQYNKSLQMNPENTRVRYKRALLFLVGGRNDKALKEFEKVLLRSRTTPWRAWERARPFSK